MKTEAKFGTTTSTMGGKSVSMNVKTEDMGAIMAILTDIYTDALAALPREYACNAYDAHKEAGVQLPIQVTLPSRFNPALQIQDFGVGMDADTIERIYANYGASTKRDTDEQIGGFGIGCKSALSYTNQFTVTSVKDGFKVIVLIARNDDDSGVMEILNAPDADELEAQYAAGTPWRGEPTEEANGTTVSIAIRSEDHGRLGRIVADFFQYWEKGTVLVNDQQPARFDQRGDEVVEVAKGVYLVTSGYSTMDRIVMGGVSYPPIVPFKRSANAPRFGLVVFTPIGSVTPHPSREVLRDTAVTRKTVAEIEKRAQEGLRDMAQRQVNKAKSYPEALRLMVQWSPYATGGLPLEYKGDRMPNDFSPKVGQPGTTASRYGFTVKTTPISSPFNGNISDCYETRSIPTRQWHELLWVKGFEPLKFSPTHKKKILKWLADNDINTKVRTLTNAVLLRGDDFPDPKFIDPKHVVSWDTIKAIKLPRSASLPPGQGRISGSYDIFTEQGYKSQVLASDFRKDKPLIWTQGNKHSAERILPAIRALQKEFTFVFLSMNRVGKFRRDFPKAKSAQTIVDDGVAAWLVKQSPEDRKAYSMVLDNRVRIYARLDPKKVNDPELRAAIKIAHRDIQSFQAEVNAMRQWQRSIAGSIKTPYSDPLRKYSFYHTSWSVGNPDPYLYLNAKYADLKKKGKAA